MKRSSFRHYKLKKSDRHQLSVRRFLGVDYSTQKFLVSDGRAIDLKNFIYRDGIVQKRHGYEQILTIKTISYIPSDFDNPTSPLVNEIHTNENDKQVNAIWAFVAEDKETHIIAHIGKLIYQITNMDNDNIVAEPIFNGVASVDGEQHFLAYEFENFKSFAFVGGNKLWFLGGNKYMCLRFIKTNYSTNTLFFAVENSDLTPIPTTTISITYKNSIVNRRTGLDNVNLLTEWRKNKFISGTTKEENEKSKTTFYEYTLDAPIIAKSPSDMSKITVTIEEQGEIE